jgi:hypothetical protein
MSILIAAPGTSDFTAVGVAAAALGSTMAANVVSMFVSTTNCWIKQGTTKLVTCVAKASLAEGDYVTIAIDDGLSKVYEFDLAPNGVTSGRIVVDISADTTAIQVAARLRTAILANQATLTVTDNGNGTLTITAPDKIMTITESVANAGFTVANTIVPAAAAAGSMYVPANVYVHLDGKQGPQLGVIRATADGSASLTKTKRA